MSNQIATTKSDLNISDYNSLNDNFLSALNMVDDIILKNYISKLNEFEIVPIDERTKKMNLSENVRLFKITEMVYEKDELSTYKFASVFNALSTTNCAVFIIVDSDGTKTDFYMGIRSLNSEQTTASLKDTLKNAMLGQFPGIKTQEFLDDEMTSLIDKSKYNNLSIVSCIANSKNSNTYENRHFVQGLEKLALAMQGERYTGIILANGTTRDQLTAVRKGYESIYTQLSPFANMQLSYGKNQALSVSDAFTFGKTVGTSHSTNTSKQTGTSETEGITEGTSTTKANSITSTLKGIGMAAAGILTMVGAAALTVGTGGLAAPVAIAGISTTAGALMAGGAVGTGLAAGITPSSKTTNTSYSSSKTVTTSETYGETDSVNESQNESTTQTKGLTTGTSENLQLTMQNKSINSLLERIDTQLKRLGEFESLGMWECAAYFLSEKPHAAEIAASTYKALMIGENSGAEVSAINSWHNYNKQEIVLLKEYALNMMHPVFKYKGALGDVQITPCSLVSGNELALHMGLPRKSVCGFPVIEHADFGKEVVSYANNNFQSTINLGKIFNMGSECNNTVKLDRNSLSMHTFITGSTGSGKSNTVYEILRRLDTVGIKFLVIEPAKGEYKNIFGRFPNVKVFGTNPAITDLLRINPFKFPKSVHVLEHIDRLIEIFNVCWPMYAAMPAVLKEAVLNSYEGCGWDLVESVNTIDDDLFPTFEDLLAELVNVIDNSSYSQEIKSNYKGSLETRVKSLTNGLNGQIFSVDELDNSVLFDSNVIVDLSRIGSLETKSLIMGILIMRLNEHRMAYTEGMNQPLKHITVLEEAHNILKRTSTEQSSEGSNLAGKSVELLSNAIAEMRTYGEGFIIADQSPSAVDISAIRNTNTKIIMRLPDEADRRTSGKAAALKDEQLDEIAKLPKGVAVVYQNDWIEPVLCKVNKYSGVEFPYDYSKDKHSGNTSLYDNWFKTELLKLLVKGRINESVEIDIDRLKEELSFARFSTKNKIGIHRLLNEYERTNELALWDDSKFAELSSLVSELLNAKNRVNNLVENAKNYNEISIGLIDFVNSQLQNFSKEISLNICQCLMRDYCSSDSGKNHIYSDWIDFEKEVM